MEGTPEHKKVSVICVTNRKGFAPILKDDMDRQTFRDFEVIVADDNFSGAPEFDAHFKPRKKNNGDVWNINKAYNDAIDRAGGELLIFLQDFIWIPANGLQRFWDMHEIYPDSFITGVGHKAKDGLQGISERDDRALGEDSFSKGNFSHWELNWACAPKDCMPRFNEEMDAFYGGENQYVANKSGCPVYIDRQNECIGYSQDYCGGRPVDWEEKHANKAGRLARFLR